MLFGPKGASTSDYIAILGGDQLAHLVGLVKRAKSGFDAMQGNKTLRSLRPQSLGMKRRGGKDLSQGANPSRG